MDLNELKKLARLRDRYSKQLDRLRSKNIATDSIEQAVKGAIEKLKTSGASSVVIYGEPQSGKTEMMICLTAKLLDLGRSTIVHLMNDSVDLLTQNLRRFKASGLAPAPRSLSELLQSTELKKSQELVVFCKKNRRDLDKLKKGLKGRTEITVIDDEADYATPNAKINVPTKTRINQLVGKLIGKDGSYIGVTATPARLDLNKTFKNDAEKWVQFPAHPQYTGQDTFFPLDNKVSYRRTLLKQGGSAEEAEAALVNFLVTAAYLNTRPQRPEENYTMLVHTSGKREDHETDRVMIEKSVQVLLDSDSKEFEKLATKVYEAAEKLFSDVDPKVLTEYVVRNASRATLIVLNSERDRKAAGENPTEPSSPFTIIIGGNIISRGVTFPNLLSMFFTRDVKHKLQQDTYIQRARMFGARGKYLEYFELTIPSQLYADWHRCFVFHKLALATVSTSLGSPVWIGDSRIAVASKSSIDQANVTFEKGEMSFGMFTFSEKLDEIVLEGQTDIETLKKLQKHLGPSALPKFLVDYIEAMTEDSPGAIAIHTASPIAGYGSRIVRKTIARRKGFIGKSQREEKKFPDARHHIKIFYNEDGKGRLFYKFQGSLQFIQNLVKMKALG